MLLKVVKQNKAHELFKKTYVVFGYYCGLLAITNGIVQFMLFCLMLCAFCFFLSCFVYYFELCCLLVL